VVVDVDSSEAQKLAGKLGDRALFAAADVGSESDVQSAVDAAVGRFGGIQVAVNCAGIAPPGRVLDRDCRPLALGTFASVVDVNLVGTFNVMRLVAAQMCRQEPEADERGVIVNTASIAAFEGQIGQVAYAASKGGIVGMTLPVARDLAGRLIRCVAIAPGTFDTPMLAGLGDDVRRALAENIPHPRRLGLPSEYASLVAHVVSNPMINGEVIRLDGALRMPPR
jgi:NAD(P)-dependent dehydrogenase (short-subunit alcohol dehydrogenase family)